MAKTGGSLLGVALDVGEAERLLHQPLVPRLLLFPRVPAMSPEHPGVTSSGTNQNARSMKNATTVRGAGSPVAAAPLAKHLQPLLRLHADRARVESLHAQRAECLRSNTIDSSEAPGHRGEADAGCAR